MSDPFSPPAGTHAGPRQYFGKYPGLVLDNAPPADDPHRGRILVEVPGILEEVPPDGTAQRAVQLLAKPCFPAGFFFIPQVGHQVWVEFAAGDVNEPLWSGAWYPEKGTPHTVADAPPTAAQKVIRTASGHVVQLDDTDGEEKVMVSHKTGSFVSIDKDGTVVIGNHLGSTVILNAKDENVVIVDQHANSVRMTDEGITIVKMGGNAALQLSDDGVRVAGKNIALQGTAVTVADGGQSVLSADEGQAIAFEVMWKLFKNHMHATAMGPSGPPLPPPPDIKVSKALMVK